MSCDLISQKDTSIDTILVLNIDVLLLVSIDNTFLSPSQPIHGWILARELLMNQIHDINKLEHSAEISLLSFA